MPDYNLYGLSWRTFEQLVQALAVEVIGPKTVIFGAGRDGGREATYEGHIPYPSEQDSWRGYLVVQAKFRERPETPGKQSDGDWALGQLRAELQEFADPEKGRRCPDYYIFATNVVLSPYPEKGAKDQARAIFEEFKDRVPIKDFDIWDYDKISAFLDNAESIRRAYGAWITPGDVLADVIKCLKWQLPDFERVIINFLQKELALDQNVRLDQAGHATDQRTSLAKVFVDLSISRVPRLDPPNEKPEEPLPPGFAAYVVDMGSARLDSKTLCERTVEPEQDQTTVPGRLVLIGGPGQGKTTVSQFIAQLYRAAILKDRPKSQIDPDVRPILDLTLEQCKAEGIGLPAGRRFPVRVVLSEFAAKVASGEYPDVTSLLSYLVHRIRLRTDRRIEADDLRLWLTNYPWMLLLDGLDEVPPSSNRDEVLAKIREFWVDATECNADLLVIATTRPQGYQGEFGKIYEHWHLTPLSKTRAMHYGRRFAAVRHGTDAEQRETVLRRLQSACDNDATSRLMRSPLQVTIMATLVAQLGQPPRERWSLFKKYYEILYQREIEKETHLSEILSEQRHNINTIHHRVGLTLQIESERAGNTEAKLSDEEFRQIVVRQLVDEGFSDPQLDQISQQIIGAATERLVFLVGLEADRVGFEIRSLQEWMAAEELMAADDQTVDERLRAIAVVSHWRNVFLFAVGKCFAERGYLRDTVLSICLEMNEAVDQGLEKAILAGSTLALDIIEDGSVRQQPKYGRLFTRLALRLLELPPEARHSRLAGQCESTLDPEIEKIYLEELEMHLGHAIFEKRLGAWDTLLGLLARELSWANELAERYWPSNFERRLAILDLLNERPWQERWSQWAIKRLIEMAPHISPLRVRQVLETMRFTSLRFQPEWLRTIIEYGSYLREIPFISINEIPALSFSYTGIGQEARTGLRPYLELPNPTEPSWQPLVASARLLENPCKKTLACELSRLAGELSPSIKLPFMLFPWPLAVCLWRYAERKESLGELASKVELGELGDIGEWECIEASWEKAGINERDLLNAAAEDWNLADIVDGRVIPVWLFDTLRFRRYSNSRSRRLNSEYFA